MMRVPSGTAAWRVEMNRPNRAGSPPNARSTTPASSAGSSGSPGRNNARARSSAGGSSYGGPTYTDLRVAVPATHRGDAVLEIVEAVPGRLGGVHGHRDRQDDHLVGPPRDGALHGGLDRIRVLGIGDARVGGRR